MKIKVLAISVLAFLAIGVNSADAYYYMTYGQAKRETWRHAKETCERLSECTGYAAGSCRRRSSSAFDCVAGYFYPGPGIEPEETLECNEMLHWGVNRRGIIVLKAVGKPHCFYV